MLSYIQIEVTDKCNAHCPGCLRNFSGGETNTQLADRKEIDFDQWKKLVNTLPNSVNSIQFNGNLGDALMNTNLTEMLDYLSETHSHLMIFLHTNGGAGSLDKWSRLATILNKFKGHEVIFGIDGLEDTNEIHRRNVKWNKLISNIKEFINNKGKAVIKFIPFEHNKHQVAELKDLAVSLGVSAIRSAPSYAKEIFGKEYKQYKSATLVRVPVEEVSSLLDYGRRIPFITRKNNSTCPWKTVGGVQISSDNKAWPCCWIAGNIASVNYLEKKYGQDFNSLEKNSLEYFISGEFYSNLEQEIPNLEICSKCPGRS